MKGCLRVIGWGVVGFIGLCVVAALLDPGPSSTSTPTPPVATEAPPIAIEAPPARTSAEIRTFVRTKLAELDAVRRTEAFRVAGLGAGGPLRGWLDAIQAERAHDDQYEFDERFALTRLVELGMEYVATEGRDTDWTRELRADLDAYLRGG